MSGEIQVGGPYTCPICQAWNDGSSGGCSNIASHAAFERARMTTEQIGEAETALLKHMMGDYAFKTLYDKARAEIVAQTRREACEAVCQWCAKGLRIADTKGDPFHMDVPSGRDPDCEAWAIRSLMEPK